MIEVMIEVMIILIFGGFLVFLNLGRKLIFKYPHGKYLEEILSFLLKKPTIYCNMERKVTNLI